ncbi:MLL4 [Mytilus coruscus]|uniref:MLL4 n=1 Tax=Mytilus coruscus TaxID=42192 RepID=A0A6J8EXR4_MYTCO|nr:MLL4 [Mytilus coruscus]
MKLVPKCNKKCRTRSTYCDTGNHWVHYKCQKLTQQEIQIAENSNGEDYYECKLCCEAKSSLLALKRCAQSNIHAQQLLEEETELLKVWNKDETSTNRQPEENCAVCDTMLIDPVWDICEDCNNKCHVKCMTEINGTYICIPCIILQEELKQQQNINKDLAIVTPHRNIEGKNQETTLLNEELTQLATIKPIPKPRKPQMKQQNLDDPTLPKLSELRAREFKVKKVEEQLKIKETSLNEIRNEKILLESRCQQLEARNFELEQTDKLLKRRIASDSHLAMPASPNTCESPTSSQDVYHKMKQELDQKLANLHTKLSNIVLDEMDRQLDKIKLFDGNQQAATESLKTDSIRQTEKKP